LLVNLRAFVTRHPILVAWAVLAIGMVIMLLYAAKDVSLLPSQVVALVIATILLAGACVWILTWD
jgi:hypothetical protein